MSDEFCGMCGSTENLHHSEVVPGNYSWYIFCKGGKCFDQYRDYAYYTNNLTNGIPYLWTLYSNEKYYSKVPERVVSETGEVEDLTCAYCGDKSPNVISHPRVPKKYKFTSFCKNDVCYKDFVIYMRSEIKHVPYALRTDKVEDMDVDKLIDEFEKMEIS